MKNLIQAVAVAAALIVPVASFAQAQPDGALTRAQVQADLVQLEQTGWRPGAGDNTRYPADVQSAEKQVAAANGANGADTSGYGGVSNAMQSGSRPVVQQSDWDSMYRHP